MTEILTARHTGNAGIVFHIEKMNADKSPADEGSAEKSPAEKNQAEKNPGKAVLGIDAFCRDRKGLYMDTPEQERVRLLSEIESGGLRTLVFTHEHGDHFCLEDVLEALKRNPRLHIISTRKVIQRIREKSPDGILEEIGPEETGSIDVELPGDGMPRMKLRLFNAPHMGEQFADIQNLVCLLEAGGRRLLIPGDARPDAALFERAAAWSPVIDWLIAPFPLMGLPSSRKKIASAFTVRHALAVHLPRPEKDEHGWRASALKVCERARDGLPMPLFGDVIGETYLL